MGVSASNFNAASGDYVGQTRAVTKKCVCVCVHVHFCVFTFISPSVCAWKCVPGIVCLYKQMDENLRLLRSPSLRLSFLFFFPFLTHGGPSCTKKTTLSISSGRLSPLTQNAHYLPSLFLLIGMMCSSLKRFFFLCVFCFVSSSLSASLSPRVVLALHITPDTMGRACKIQRATLQTSWNLLCVYSNNFNPWLFTEQLQRCVWLWLKVFSVEKRTERSQIKSLCYCGFFFFLFWGVLFFFFLTSTL